MTITTTTTPTPTHRIVRRAGAVLAAATFVGATVSLAASPATAAPTKANPYSPFIRQWYGHDRYMTVSSKGVGVEHVNDGCCTMDVRYTYQLSHVHRLPGGRPVATLTITGIKTYPGGSHGHLKVGQHGTATSLRGVFRDSLIGVTFCSSGAKTGSCGA